MLNPEVAITVLFNILIIGLLLIGVGACGISAKNIEKKLSVHSVLSYPIQNEIFKVFIKKLIEDKENVSIETIEELYKIIKKKDIYDVHFKTREFEKYLQEYCEQYKINFPLNFFSNLANLILLNECIENVLVQTHNSSDSEFTLILSENYSLL